MYGEEAVTCSRGKDGLDYVDITITKDGREKSYKALVKSGSDATIFGAKSLGISTDGLKKINVAVGFESIDVYEAEIEAICIGAHEIYGVDMVYVSDLEAFDATPILGSDYLGKMNYHKGNGETITLEFEPFDVGNSIVEERRQEYLSSTDRRDFSINLDGFFFIEDGMYPSDFEVVLVVMKDGSLSGGCVERGSRYTEENWRGVIHQSRGGVIEYENILAWKPIENINVFE